MLLNQQSSAHQRCEVLAKECAEQDVCNHTSTCALQDKKSSKKKRKAEAAQATQVAPVIPADLSSVMSCCTNICDTCCYCNLLVKDSVLYLAFLPVDRYSDAERCTGYSSGSGYSA